jgi:branched-subunit amino acid ABC-type transport system permease component
MTFWAFQVLNGVPFGTLLFLLGAGLSLVYGVLRILNVAHGSYYVLGRAWRSRGADHGQRPMPSAGCSSSG